MAGRPDGDRDCSPPRVILHGPTVDFDSLHPGTIAACASFSQRGARRPMQYRTPASLLPFYFPLMSHRDDDYLIGSGVVLILRQVTGSAAVDHELAPLAPDGAADEGIFLEHAQRFEDQASGFPCGLRIFIAKEGDEPSQILHRRRQ
jgi:hypothetical protein